MRFLLALCLLGVVAAAEPTKPAPIMLANDQAYADKVQAVLAERPDGKDQQKLFRWVWSYFSACMDNRSYGDAEVAARTMLALAPQYNIAHSNLSVVLGKQGKYQEALQEAEIAKLLNPSDSMHPESVACSWLYHLGRKQEAIERFKSIPVPTEIRALRAYWGCKACFYASVGSVEEIKSAIVNALTSEPDRRGFFERDMVFDQYRAEPWFIELVGKTLR